MTKLFPKHKKMTKIREYYWLEHHWIRETLT